MALTKRQKNIAAAVEPGKTYAIDDAIKIVKDHSKSKFVEAVDVMVRKPHAPAGVPFTPTTGVMAGPAVSVRRERRRAVVIAMGTNLGRRVATMRSALESLRALDGLDVVHVSPLVETDPVGGVEQPDYLNAVVVGFTRLTGEHLLAELHRIEAEHGRRRDVRWGVRTLDLDVVTLGEAGREDEIVLADERDGVQAGAADAFDALVRPGRPLHTLVGF